MPTTFFILAGETSGDQHAAKLLRALKAQEPDARFVGMGGPCMAAAGLEVAKDLDGMQVMGFWEVAKKYGFFKKVFYRLLDRVKQEKPAALICIDYPGFNLRFAREVHRLGIPVYYYIVPQVWAWKPGRARSMARCIDRVFCVFPFEPPFFARFGLKAEFVGHPLVDVAQDATAVLTRLPEGGRTVSFLPGSRESEFAALALPLYESSFLAHETFGDLRCLMSIPANIRPESPVIKRLMKHMLVDDGREGIRLRVAGDSGGRKILAEFPERVVEEGAKTLDALNALPQPHAAMLPALSDFSIVKSGTSTLEAGLAGQPLCVVYRSSPLSYGIAHLLVNIPVFSLVNIVLGKYAVPELLQSEVNPRRLAEEISRGLLDKRYREQQKQALAELPQKLGGPGASARAARGILAALRGR